MSEAAVITRRTPNEAAASPAGSVLIIDDEAAIRESLQTLLEFDGYDVESAADGESGLARIRIAYVDFAGPHRGTCIRPHTAGLGPAGSQWTGSAG